MDLAIVELSKAAFGARQPPLVGPVAFNFRLGPLAQVARARA